MEPYKCTSHLNFHCDCLWYRLLQTDLFLFLFLLPPHTNSHCSSSLVPTAMLQYTATKPFFPPSSPPFSFSPPSSLLSHPPSSLLSPLFLFSSLSPSSPSPSSLFPSTHSLLSCSKLLFPTGDNGHTPVHTASKSFLQQQLSYVPRLHME